MKVDIGNNNEQSVYYNKARLEYANDEADSSLISVVDKILSNKIFSIYLLI